MGREQISRLTWSSGVGQALWGTRTASFLNTDDYINNLHVGANARPQGHLKFIGPAPGHFLLCKSPGAGHTFRCKSPGVPGGMVTGQIDTCITFTKDPTELVSLTKNIILSGSAVNT